jgi:fatty acid desaturase
MENKRLNDWEQKIDQSRLKTNKDYDLLSIYKQAHEELSLQQSKRDQIITIYLALCSFLLPFALGEEMIPMMIKGLIFIVVGIVGMLFSYIAIRYREYKEAYWLCCQTLTVLQSFRVEDLDKLTVQRAFYHCLKKKGKGYLREKNGEKRFRRLLYTKKNIFSSETLHFVIIALMCSFISALGVSLALTNLANIGIIIGVIVGLCVFTHLVVIFFRTCIKIYLPLEERANENDEERRNKAFNKVFSKAWFLHFYYDPK